MSFHWLHCFDVDIKMTFSGSLMLSLFPHTEGNLHVWCATSWHGRTACKFCSPGVSLCLRIVLSKMHLAHRTLHVFAVLHIYVLYAVLLKYFVWSQHYLTHSSAYWNSIYNFSPVYETTHTVQMESSAIPHNEQLLYSELHPKFGLAFEVRLFYGRGIPA
jgi:hypothetical protein